MRSKHLVQFYETDLMGIVHHSNYLRFFEEARVHWAHKHGFIDYQKPESARHFAVLETRVLHKKPAYFGDQLEIDIQAKNEGVKVIFQYRLLRNNEIVALGETVHVALDKNLKPIRLEKKLMDLLENTQWKEIWL
ncbi:MAG: thioesterase family protein [Bdellovibrionota bacterium]